MRILEAEFSITASMLFVCRQNCGMYVHTQLCRLLNPPLPNGTSYLMLAGNILDLELTPAVLLYSQKQKKDTNWNGLRTELE